jgi:signal peptidase I
MVRDILYHFILFLLVIGVVFGIFWAYKRINSISMESIDRSMEPEYPARTYRLELPPLTANDIVVGSAVAYRVPNEADKERLAWVLAKEGQLIEARDGSLFVDGQKPNPTLAVGTNAKWSYIVPRGCVFLLASVAVADSLRYGPIPIRNVKGRLP